MADARRPYASDKSAPASVSDVLTAMVGKEQLTFGAAGETMKHAYHHPEILDLPEQQAMRIGYSHFRGVWDGSASAGSVVHEVHEGWDRGEQVNVSALVDAYAAKTRIWQGHEEEALATVNGLLDGLERFYNEWQPVTTHTEQIVRYTEGDTPLYIGTMDRRVVLKDGRVATLDDKTTSKIDEAKGLYPWEWALQLAAYDFANQQVTYGEDEKGKPIVTGTTPWEPADLRLILHLRPTGTFKLYDLTEFSGKDYHDTFCDLARAHAKQRKMPKTPPVLKGLT